MANIYVRSTDGDDADDGSTWALAKASLTGAAALTDAGNTIFVSDAHAYSTASNISITFDGTIGSPVKVICGDDVAEPPTAVTTTGSETSTAGTLTLTGPTAAGAYVYGMAFTSYLLQYIGSAASGTFTLDNCAFSVTHPDSTTQGINFGTTGSHSTGLVIVKNSTVSLTTVGAGLATGTGNVVLDNVTLLTAQTTFIKTVGVDARGGGVVLVTGCNLSAAAAACNLVGAANGGKVIFRNCKLPASWTGSLLGSTPAGAGFRVSMYNCDSADTNYRLKIQDYAGTIDSETTIVRTGGASDGTTTLAWKMATRANASYPLVPLVSDEIVRWNNTVASAITATVEIVHDSQGAGTGSDFQNDEIWLEVMYLGTSGVPLGSFISSAKANVLATAADITNSTETWTTTGLTTPVKQKLSVTFTPQEKGFIHAKVYLAKASKTVYVDPKITVS